MGKCCINKFATTTKPGIKLLGFFYAQNFAWEIIKKEEK